MKCTAGATSGQHVESAAFNLLQPVSFYKNALIYIQGNIVVQSRVKEGVKIPPLPATPHPLDSPNTPSPFISA